MKLPSIIVLIATAVLADDNRAFAFVPKPTPWRQSNIVIVGETKAPDASDSSSSSDDNKPAPPKAIILDPFLPAALPSYMNEGPVGDGEFLVSRTGGPTNEELTDENLWKIIDRKASDLEVNTLVWKCLGYRFDEETSEWTAAEVFPKWKKGFPTPPDLIGMQRIYSKAVDGPCLRNNQALVKTIPVENKASYLKVHMKPFGFTGYKVSELTPNLTRRAQCVNWMLFYREELFGYTIEELKERRRLKQEKAEQEKQQLQQKGEEEKEEWTPPVKEVY